MVPNYSDCQKASQSFRRARRKINQIHFPGDVYVGENTSRGVSVELSAFSGQPRRRTEHNLFCQRSSSSFFDKRNYAMET